MILCFLILLSMVALIYLTPIFANKSISKHWILTAFILKVIAGFGFIWVFTNFYTDKKNQDLYIYFENGKVIQQAFTENPAVFFHLMSSDKITAESKIYYDKTSRWGTKAGKIEFSNSENTSRIVGVLCILSFGNLYTVSLLSILLAFFGFWFIFKFLSSYKPEISSSLFLIVFFLPSAVFFTAGISKESYIIFLIGILLHLESKLQFNYKSIGNILLILIFSFMLIKIRMVFLPFFIVPLFVFIAFKVLKKLKIEHSKLLLIGGILIFISLTLVIKSNFLNVLVEKRNEFILLQQISNSSQELLAFNLQPTLFSFIKTAPKALINTLLIPYHFTDNTLSNLAFIENIFVLLLLFWFVLQFEFRKSNSTILIFTLFLAIFGLVGVGWITPISGAIIRYKVVGIIFLLSFFALLSKPNKFLDIIFNKK